MSKFEILRKFLYRARNARPYNVAKKATVHCTAVPVGARIARPRFVQNSFFAHLLYLFLEMFDLSMTAPEV